MNRKPDLLASQYLWRSYVPRLPLRLAVFCLAALLLAITTLHSPLAQSPVYAQQTEGYYYTVQPGDSWGLISELTGVSVAELQQANPNSIRYNQWLRVGEQILVSAALPANASTQTRTHVVQSGEGWGTIAAQYNLTSRLLKSVNPDSIRYNDILYVGEQLTIPSVIQTAVTPVTTTDTATTDTATTDTATTDTATTESTTDAVESVTVTESLSHQVGGGDSWSIIAAAYDVTISELKAANPGSIRGGDILYLGETLAIPSKTTSGSAVAADSPTDAASEPSSGEVSAEVEPDALSQNASSSPSSAPSTSPSTSTADTPSTATGEAATGEAATGEAATDEAATDEAATDEAATDEALTGEAATDEAAADEAATDEAATDEAATDEAATDEAATDEAATDEAATDEAATDEAATDEAATDEAATDEAATDEAATDEAATDEDSTGTGDASVELESACPEMFSDYAELLKSALSAADTQISDLVNSVNGCGVLKQSESGDWTGDGVEDAFIILEDDASGFVSPEGDLFILNGLADGGFELSYQARSAGKVDLLSTQDINADDRMDISWIDTTCGASTCFATVNVRSWSDGEWRDWTDGTITMAYPDIALNDVTEDGQLFEILLSGGIYGSAGAGPQRERVEVWGSVDGEPYSLLNLTFGESNCLYFAVIDGNDALSKGTTAGLSEADDLYGKVLTDANLIACGSRENEVDELKSFSQFRKALVAAYGDDTEGAAAEIAELNSQFPASLYGQLGQVWLDTYNESGDAATACAAANLFAEDNPETWAILADFGYINPTFSAEEVCPAIEVDLSDGAEESASEDATTDEATADEAGETASAETSETATGEEADSASADASEGDSDAADETASAGEATTADASGDESGGDSGTAAEAATVSLAELPACPEALADFARGAEDAINAAAGNAEAVSAWMQSCGAMTDEFGALLHQDLDGDEVADFVLFPTLTSENGYGPGGTQGLVLIYHAIDEAGTEVELTAGPDVFGKPMPLGIEDYNEDGKMDLAFTVEGCSSFCVTEVQLLSWNGDIYIVYIASGATIAEGQVAFTPVGDGDPGAGQSIVLTGGVSGTPEGGLNVPHEEVWQSINGRPYQRISWTYDRAIEGANCLGLRLVEADMALQAAPILGYFDAVQKYTAAIDPTLQACSIQGMSAADELILLQGLASFRLIQAQALSGDLGDANTTMDALSRGQPDSLYTSIAKQWLEKYNSTGDAEAACEVARPIIEENPTVWQITDHYGYNHPALAAQQICFVP